MAGQRKYKPGSYGAKNEELREYLGPCHGTHVNSGVILPS